MSIVPEFIVGSSGLYGTIVVVTDTTELLTVARKGLRVWMTSLVSLGLILGAYFTVIYFILLPKKPLSLTSTSILLALLLHLLSLAFHHRFPRRFPTWTQPWEERSVREMIRFFLSWALSIALITRVGRNTPVWDTVMNSIDRFFETLATYGFIAPLLLVSVTAGIIVPLFLFASWVATKGVIVKSLFVAGYVALWIAGIYITVMSLGKAEELKRHLMSSLFLPAIKFLIGSLPVGWAYELFIHSRFQFLSRDRGSHFAEAPRDRSNPL